MNTILGIEVPEDLNTLSNEALQELVGELRTAAVAAAEGDVDVDTLAGIKAARDMFVSARDIFAARQEAEVALATELEAALSDLTADEDAEQPEEDDDTDEEGRTEASAEVIDIEASAEDADTDEAQAAAEKTPVVASAWQPRTRRTAAAIAEHAPEQSRNVSVADVPLKVVSGVNGRSAGENFSDLAEVSQALMDRWKDIEGGSSEKMAVARLDGRFPNESRLGENVAANIEQMGGLDPIAPHAQRAITAAMCAPAEPYYGLVGTSSTARPVAANLATYVPARGAVTIYPSPVLADISNGRGLWTRADDANSSATKVACSTIPCATPVQYDIYGIYRCMTIKNLLQMTYPELVAEFLNRLAALQAQLAEVTLLDAMTGSVNAVNVTEPAGAFGAGINLWSTLIRAIAVYREQERYDTITLDAWMPRWQREALRIDFIRQRRITGGVSDRIPTEADVDAAFRDAGVNPIWTIDNATAWGSGMTVAQSAGALNKMPTTAHMFLSIPGNFRRMDRGDLQIGVTNSNIYRDNVSNSKNEFTMFWESFEGLMDFGRKSWNLTISGFCPNGAQTADVSAMSCSASSTV